MKMDFNKMTKEETMLELRSKLIDLVSDEKYKDIPVIISRNIKGDAIEIHSKSDLNLDELLIHFENNYVPKYAGRFHPKFVGWEKTFDINVK